MNSRQLRRRDKGGVANRKLSMTEPPAVEAPIAMPAPKGLLVATEDPNAWLVFADADLPMDLDFGQFQDFPLMTEDQGQQVGKLVEQAATKANLGLKVTEGALKARGLVQLHPETLNALSTGARTLQQGGWNIGTLAGPGASSQARSSGCRQLLEQPPYPLHRPLVRRWRHLLCKRS